MRKTGREWALVAVAVVACGTTNITEVFVDAPPDAGATNRDAGRLGGGSPGIYDGGPPASVDDSDASADAAGPDDAATSSGSSGGSGSGSSSGGGTPTCGAVLPTGTSQSCAVTPNGCSLCAGQVHEYVCKDGGPPLAGCSDFDGSASAEGVYCCPVLQCVRNTTFDGACTGAQARFYDCGADAGGPGANTDCSAAYPGYPGGGEFWCCR